MFDAPKGNVLLGLGRSLGGGAAKILASALDFLLGALKRTNKKKKTRNRQWHHCNEHSRHSDGCPGVCTML
jgi:hypothetical protein